MSLVLNNRALNCRVAAPGSVPIHHKGPGGTACLAMGALFRALKCLLWRDDNDDYMHFFTDIETNAKKNPRSVLKNLDDYINKKKTVVVAEKSADPGADNFLSLCEDDAKR